MVVVRDLHKVYQVYKRPMDFGMELITGKERHTKRHVLRGLDLEVARGQVLGVMGRNGAGKSTLLRIIAGTLNASEGSVEVAGRISAILELGSGFHPQYTGRENVMMGGLCLGMTRAEIRAKLDDIVAFSELEDVIDQPFWTYSTGMQARLTFSTAVSVDPDVLIVDESLSVGDARFAAKCFRRMMDFRERGKTIILVSHDSNAVLTFCDRAIVLEGGRVYADGDPGEISKQYSALVFAGDAPELPGQDRSGADFLNRQGDGRAHIIDFGILDDMGNKTENLASGGRYQLFFRFECRVDAFRMGVGFNIANPRGILLFGITNGTQRENLTGGNGDIIECRADITVWLAAGDYILSLGIADADTGTRADFIDDAVHFRVHGPGGIITTSAVNLQADFSLHALPGAGAVE